jgi:hypothetical protein
MTNTGVNQLIRMLESAMEQEETEWLLLKNGWN